MPQSPTNVPPTSLSATYYPNTNAASSPNTIVMTSPGLTGTASPMLTGSGIWQTVGQAQANPPMPCKVFLTPRTSEDKFAEQLADVKHSDFDKLISITYSMKKNRETITLRLNGNADIFATIYQKLPSNDYYLTIEEGLTTKLSCFSRTVEILEVESMVREADATSYGTGKNQLDLVLIVKTVYVEITKDGKTEKILIS